MYVYMSFLAAVLDQEAIAASEFVVIEDDSKFLKVFSISINLGHCVCV